MARKIQLRRDTAINWSNSNPTLAQGEIGIDLTNNKLKIGTGSTAWNILSYWDDKVTDMSSFAGHIVPSTDNTYDLGAPDKQWRDIFVSEGSIYIGGIKLSNDNGTLLVQQVTDAGLVTETPIPGSTGAVTTDRLINGDAELVLTGGNNPFITFPANGTDQLFIQGSEIAATSGSIALTSIDGSIFLTTHGDLAPALAWQFDRSGTLTTPLGLPKTFTATLDTEHFVGDLTLTSSAWYFEVQFQVNPDGTVQTMIGNNTPWLTNPGYVDGQQFEYTEADHGIPGYTFTLGLADVLLAGPAGWTTNLTASVPPTYPSTVSSLGAIKLTSDTNSWTFGTDGQLTVPGPIFRDGGLYINSSGSTTAASVFVSGFAGSVILRTANNADQTSHDLILDVNGNLTLPGNVSYPGGITQSRQDDTVCNAGVDTVVYTSTGQYQHAIKLFVMIEGMAPGGDGVNWDTQACDVIAVKGFANNIIHVTTYGVTYTSAAAFATFDGHWNATTNRIEITCRPVSPTNGVTVSVHAIEMLSNN